MQNDDKKYNVIVTPRAKKMLLSHVRFLAPVNERSALKLIDEFEDKVNSLSTMAMRCPELDVPEIPRHKYRKLLLRKFYLILYQIKGDNVHVHAMIDCRQDYNWLL